MTQTRNEARVRWSNGQVDIALDWQALLDKLRLAQWHRWSEDDFRQVLGKRALRWSGTQIDTYLDPQGLFEELERAHLVEILNDDDLIEEV